jgi:hypothetical protein
MKNSKLYKNEYDTSYTEIHDDIRKLQNLEHHLRNAGFDKTADKIDTVIRSLFNLIEVIDKIVEKFYSELK